MVVLFCGFVPGPVTPWPSQRRRYSGARQHFAASRIHQQYRVSPVSPITFLRSSRVASPELRTLRDDLAAFQQEEMQALQSCIVVLVHHGSRDEASTAHALHCAARQRTRQCLVRLHAWSGMH